MKKLALIACIMLFAGSAFALEVVDPGYPLYVPDGATGAGDTLSTFSNNVTAQVLSSPSTFSAQTVHRNGSKIFGTASDSTKIFWYDRADDNEGTVNFENDLATSVAAEFGDGWTAL